jgi:magnesium chelatase accessory protein
LTGAALPAALPADWPNRDAGRLVAVAGRRWHVQQMGSGPILLLLHGTASSTHSWAGLAPLLAEHFTVVAPDLPGHGFTELGSAADLSLPGVATAVAGLLETLELQPDLVLGHSAGAAILARMCLDGQLEPAAIIGINAALLPFEGLMGRVFPPAARLLAKVPGLPSLVAFRARHTALAEKVIEQTGTPPDAIDLTHYRKLLSSPDHVAAALGMMANWDLETLERDLLQLAVPLHLVACLGDEAVPAAQARYLANRLACATLHTVPDCGHLGHEEAPQRFARLVGEIAAEVLPAASN